MALNNGAQRTKELLRYFETDDIADLSFTKESSTLNDALLPHLQLLTIFCQVDHVFVSVFDRSQLYIIAEVTAKASHAKHRFGCKGNSLEGKLCTYALELESSDDDKQPIFQISDLQSDERFNTLPFIKDLDGPRYRFYAGTPIISLQGVSMGTIAVFATQPRTPVSTDEQCHLREATRRITDYLELRREAAAGTRLGALAGNFTNFVQNVSRDTVSSPNTLTHGPTKEKQSPTINGAPKARKNGYSVTDAGRIFDGAVLSIENALQLDSGGGVIFLKASSNFATGTTTDLKSLLDKVSCRVIASSASLRDVLASSSSTDLESLATEDLKDLVEASPRGRLWQYDSHGILSNDTPDKQSLDTQHTPHNGLVWPNLLRRLFLHVRQVAFVPLLNAASGEWQDVCFVWSTYSTRMFNDIDLIMIFTYGQAIMTERAIQDALKSNLQKSDFLGSISHELRTPLHGILTSLELLQHDQNISTYQSTMLETIGKCGTALLDTINHILEFSKINTFQTTDECQTSDKSTKLANGLTRKKADGLTDLAVQFNLVSLLEEVADMVWSTNTQTISTGRLLSEPCMVLDIAREDWFLYSHKGAITRVLMNIIGNAFKYTQAGFIRVELCLERAISVGSLSSSTQHILLKVTDTGIGISPEFLESRVFVPFSQEDPLQPGVGLGLSICKKIITDLGGDIFIQSEQGLGTVVTVEIPLPESALIEDQESVDHHDKHIHDLISLSDLSKIKESLGSLRCAYLSSKNAQSSPPYGGLEASICRYLTKWFEFDQVLITDLQKPDLLVMEETYVSQLKDDQCLELLSKSSNLILVSTSPETRPQLRQRMKHLCISNFQILCVPCGPHKLMSCISSLFVGSKADLAVQENDELSPPSQHTNGTTSDDVSNDRPDTPVLLRKLDSLNIEDTQAAPQPPPIHTSNINNINNHTSQPPPPAITTSPIAPSTSTPRLLLVDDNLINLRLLQTFLQKKSYTDITLATDGRIAVDLVTFPSPSSSSLPLPFDIILMDISMPIMNGFDATLAIRAHEKKFTPGQHATIIALTGLANERDQIRGFESGMDLYLTKPVKLKELETVLKERLRVRREGEREMGDGAVG